MLSGLRADLRGDLWGRLRAARELVELTPASVEGYTLAASTALMINRPRESLTILSKVDPDRGLLLVAPFYWESHTSALHRLGERAAELESARRAVRRFPDRFWPHVNLLLALAAAGDVRRPAVSSLVRPATIPMSQALARLRSGCGASCGRTNTTRRRALAGDAWSRRRPPPMRTPRSQAGSWRGTSSSRPAMGKGPATLRRGAGPTSKKPDAAGTARRYSSADGRSGRGTSPGGELAALSDPYLFGRQTYARARIVAALGDRADAVELLQEAWIQGRPLAFDGRDTEDVHSDPAFESLREFVPFQALMRTD